MRRVEVRRAARDVPHPAVAQFGAHPAGERYGADAIEDRERLEQIGLVGALGERGGLVVGTSGCSPEIGGAPPVAARLHRERMLVVVRDLDLVAGAHQQVGELGAQRAGHEAVGLVELRTCDGAGRGEVATQQGGLRAGSGDRSAPLQFAELVGEATRLVEVGVGAVVATAQLHRSRDRQRDAAGMRSLGQLFHHRRARRPNAPAPVRAAPAPSAGRWRSR